jgi:3-oxoacyl-[acyl-carrier-protein] synthase-3
MNNTVIRGMGMAVPDKILTNSEIADFVDTNDEWITTRTGIRERRIIEQGTPASDLAKVAAERALRDAGMQAEELTHIIFSTFTPDSYCPASACRLAHKLGVKNVTAFDMNAACSGFLYGLDTARAFVALHPEAKVLLAAVDVLSTRLNWQDRSTCVLFGDGAGAVVVTSEDQNPKKAKIIDVALESDGEFGDFLTMNGGGSVHPYKLGEPVDEEYFIKMQGSEVFKLATRAMQQSATEMLNKHGLGIDDIGLLIPHQANLRIIDYVVKKLRVPEEKVFVNLDKYGNTSAASVPLAFCEAYEQGRLSPGDKVLMITFGGGFTWGAALIEC